MIGSVAWCVVPAPGLLVWRLTGGVAVQLRQRRLKSARTILGMAIGKAPKPKLFKFYIDLETQLAQVRLPGNPTQLRQPPRTHPHR